MNTIRNTPPAKCAEPPNKELKLTKPSQDGASQLNSVFDGRAEGARANVGLGAVATGGERQRGTPATSQLFAVLRQNETGMCKVDAASSEQAGFQCSKGDRLRPRAWAPRSPARRACSPSCAESGQPPIGLAQGPRHESEQRCVNAAGVTYYSIGRDASLSSEARRLSAVWSLPALPFRPSSPLIERGFVALDRRRRRTKS
jgi:hypothetical protein